MKDIKHIRRNFYSVAWVMPQGSDLGVPWGVEWSKKLFFPKFNKIWCVSYLHEWHMQRHNFFGPHPLGPYGGVKWSNIIKSQSQSQFQRFLNQLCVSSHKLKILNISDGIFILSPGSCTRVGLFGPRLLGPWGGAKRSNILNLKYKVNFKDF